MLVMLGFYDSARLVFEDVERRQPGLYNTAANLGTTYELLGRDADALQWLRKAVRIDPGSHDGSEWIHLRILEAKVSGQDSLINIRFLIGQDFGRGRLPQSVLSGGQLDTLATQLYYQLNERVSFVKPPEKIVATLLFALGELHLLRGNRLGARTMYGMAKDYGYSERAIDARLKAINMLWGVKPRQPTAAEKVWLRKRDAIMCGIAGVAALGLVVGILRKRRD